MSLQSPNLNPLFPPLSKRLAGVFCHLTSLPTDTGIGNLGLTARQFIDFLKSAGFSLWQVCPIGPTGYGDSPYQTFSSYAGNPYLLDWQEFRQHGWLAETDYLNLRTDHPETTDYGQWYQRFWPVWHRTAANFLKRPGDLQPEYQKFVTDEATWLTPYSLFSALKEKFAGAPWQQWPAAYRKYPLGSKASLTAEDRAIQESFQVSQFFFFRQWQQLREYAAQAGIRLMGDVPIYVAYDSADLWANQAWFELNSKGTSTRVAGVPPDYFSPEGQLWGNPLYNWRKMAEDRYFWWNSRIRHNLRLFDTLRLDHFRGFAAYWSVPASAETAKSGKWITGPGLDLLREWQEFAPVDSLVAEDLGLITSEVRELLYLSGLPRMAVLQFAFDGNSDNDYLPHNHERNMVVYSGTHDNNTSVGWYQEASPEEQDLVRRYLQVSAENPGWDLIRAGYRSPARWAIFPLQDLLGLGSEARFNTPGVAQNNWSWRATREQLEQCRNESADYLNELALLYGRHPSTQIS